MLLVVSIEEVRSVLRKTNTVAKNSNLFKEISQLLELGE